MQVTRYQLMQMLHVSYLESAELHRQSADLDTKAADKILEEMALMTIEEADSIITINEEKLSPDMRERLRKEA